MTNEHAFEIAKILAIAVPASSAILTAIIKLSPAWLTARTAAKLQSDDEARKQRDEIRADRDRLKVDLERTEAELDYVKEQFYKLREVMIDNRAVCIQKGNQCAQDFTPIRLEPFVSPLPPVPTEKEKTP